MNNLNMRRVLKGQTLRAYDGFDAQPMNKVPMGAQDQGAFNAIPNSGGMPSAPAASAGGGGAAAPSASKPAQPNSLLSNPGYSMINNPGASLLSHPDTPSASILPAGGAGSPTYTMQGSIPFGQPVTGRSVQQANGGYQEAQRNPKKRPVEPFGLREGGEIHADLGGMWANAKRAVQGQAPETASEAMNRRLARPAPPPAPPAPAPAPAQPAPAPAAPMGNQTVIDSRMKAAGLRNGGTLRTGHGGDVPGTGTGDKIPAKYEPGEFVVSNDMLDAQPSLRGHLQSLRKEVLAEKGMTPEQADAKALGQKPGLRAIDGMYTTGPDGVTRVPQFPAPSVVPEAVPAGNAAPVAPRTPNPEAAGRYIGGRVKDIISSAPAKALTKGVSAAAALYQGNKAANDFNDGNYVGAVEHGGRAALAAAPLNPLTGAAMAGMAVGDVAYSHMSDDTKDSIGSTLNSGVRKLGSAVGQDWGVDDTAMRTLRGQPLSPGVNAGAPKPAPGSAPEQDFSAANAAKLAAPDAVPKIGDLRNVDNEAGTQDVFTKGAWSTVSTPEAKAARGLRDEQYQARLARDHEATVNGPTSFKAQLRNMQDMNADTQRQQVARGEITDPRAREAILADAAQRNTLRGQESQNAAHVQGAKIGADAQRDVASSNARSARANLLYQAGIDQRNFKRETDNDNFTQGQAADKAWNDHANSLFQVAGPDGKGMIPDTQKAAAYTRAVDHTVGKLAEMYAKSPDPKMRAMAAELNKRGRAALDPQDRANMQKLFEVQQLHAKDVGAGPFSSGGAASQNLLDYKLTGSDQTLGQERSKTAGGQSIPKVTLRYGADANHFLPNWGPGSNYLTQ